MTAAHNNCSKRTELIFVVFSRRVWTVKLLAEKKKNCETVDMCTDKWLRVFDLDHSFGLFRSEDHPLSCECRTWGLPERWPLSAYGLRRSQPRPWLESELLLDEVWPWRRSCLLGWGVLAAVAWYVHFASLFPVIIYSLLMIHFTLWFHSNVFFLLICMIHTEEEIIGQLENRSKNTT